MKEWIGVDLDGTLAHYDGWQGIEHIGPIVESMKERVLRWIEQGHQVKIFTARVSARDPYEITRIVTVIHQWLFDNDLPLLEVTCTKDFGMSELWDDRCVAIEPNTGKMLSPSRRGLS
jgi:hypothetical protein